MGSGDESVRPCGIPFALIEEMGGEIGHRVDRVVQFPFLMMAGERF